MSTCTHHIDDDPDGLRCLLDAHPEHPNGHRYSGKSVSDGHDVSEQRAEEAR